MVFEAEKSDVMASRVPYTMDELVAKFLELKGNAEALTKEQDAAMKPYKEAMATIKNFLLLKLDEQGETSVKTKSGTAYVSSGFTPKVSDRGVLLDHVREHEHWDLLDIGVLLDPVKEFLDKSGGKAPLESRSKHGEDAT